MANQDKQRQKKRQQREAHRRAVLKQRPNARPHQVKLQGPKEPERPQLATTTPELLLADTKNWPDEILRDVGFELHRCRKVTPMTEEEAGNGAEYDDLVGIHYGIVDCRTSGFRIQAKPRRVGTADAAKYANPGCRKCKGVGRWHVSRAQKVGVQDGGKPIFNTLEYEVNCECAERGYRAKHKNLLIDSQLGEWILLEDLIVGRWEEPDVLSKMPKLPDPERHGEAGVPEVSEAGG